MADKFIVNNNITRALFVPINLHIEAGSEN